jgi:hypothetical protein
MSSYEVEDDDSSSDGMSLFDYSAPGDSDGEEGADEEGADKEGVEEQAEGAEARDIRLVGLEVGVGRRVVQLGREQDDGGAAAPPDSGAGADAGAVGSE